MSRRPSNIFKKTVLPGLLTVALALSLVFSDGILPIPADLHGEPVTYQLFILIGIVLVAAFVIDDFFQERELDDLVQRLAVSACPTCGKEFGLNEAWRARVTGWGELPDENAVESDINGTWRVRCPECRAAFAFRKTSGELSPLTDEADASPFQPT